MHLRLALLAVFSIVAGIAGPADVPDAPRYVSVPATADGIGKRYMDREIAQVMGAGGASWLERSERAHEERPDLVLAALDIKPGMTIADIGAGTGYYARRLARRTGSRGVVYAVEVQPA